MMKSMTRWSVRAGVLFGLVMCVGLLPLNTTHAAPIPVTFLEFSHPHSVHASETFNAGRLTSHPGEGHWGLHAGAHGAWDNGLTLRELKFHEEGKDVFSGGAHHHTGPSLNGAVTSPRWHHIFQDADKDDARVQGTVHHLTAVPLPAAVVLFGASVASLMAFGAGAARSRRKHQA